MTASLLSESNTPWPYCPGERGLVAEALALERNAFLRPYCAVHSTGDDGVRDRVGRAGERASRVRRKLANW